MKPVYYILPIVNFLFAASLGLLLRGLQAFSIEGIEYLYIVHAHSHVALLGWLYMLFYVLIVQNFSYKTQKEHRFYTRLFWYTELAVIGMTFTFPFVGYNAYSIFFCTLHIICSYIFAFRIWRNNCATGSRSQLLKTALFFMLLSTIGVWCLGPAVSLLGKTSAIYQICIQFFLHFQFDGWFLTIFLCILFATNFKDIFFQKFKVFYALWVSSVLLTFALPLSWSLAIPSLQYLNTLGVILQIIAVSYLIKPLYSYLKSINENKYLKILFLFVGLCFLARVFLQLFVISESIFYRLEAIRSWIIGFIHLNMLGVLSGFGVWQMIENKKMNINTWSKAGILILIIGFVTTESILLIQGCQIFFGFYWFENISVELFYISTLLPLSISCLLLSYRQGTVKEYI